MLFVTDQRRTPTRFSNDITSDALSRGWPCRCQALSQVLHRNSRSSECLLRHLCCISSGGSALHLANTMQVRLPMQEGQASALFIGLDNANLYKVGGSRLAQRTHLSICGTSGGAGVGHLGHQGVQAPGPAAAARPAGLVPLDPGAERPAGCTAAGRQSGCLQACSSPTAHGTQTMLSQQTSKRTVACLRSGYMGACLRSLSPTPYEVVSVIHMQVEGHLQLRRRACAASAGPGA